MNNEQACVVDTSVPSPTRFSQREYFRAWIARKLVEDPDYLRRKSARHYADNPSRRREMNETYRERSGFNARPSVAAKVKARSVLRTAVWRGKVAKPTACPACGNTVPPHRMHAHHDDYAKPLDVTWLCTACHGKEHRTK